MIGIPFAGWVLTRDLVSMVAIFWAIILGFFALKLIRSRTGRRGDVAFQVFAQLFAATASLYSIQRLDPTRSWGVVAIAGGVGILVGVLAYRDMVAIGWMYDRARPSGADETAP